jgi:trimethylamine:corrinoid methyltransferase-like protein
MPHLFDRNAYAVWEQQGKISLEQRVGDKLQRILRSHRPPELPEGVGKEIEAIIKKTE